MFLRTLVMVFAALLNAVTLFGGQPSSGLRFEIALDSSMSAQPPGRLLVVIAPGVRFEPKRSLGRTGRGAVPTIGVDVPALAPGDVVTVGMSAATFPLSSLAELPAGEHTVQAVLSTNRDLLLLDAPGNLYSDPVRVIVEPDVTAPVRVTLTHRVSEEQLPPDDEHLRFIRIRSELLSAFHRRPIYLRAGVILPRGFNEDSERRYPLRIRTGGYGDRYTAVQAMMLPGSSFRTAWMAEDAPRMLLIHLDGAGPYGDPYQVNSANNGPYGDAVTRELIPYVEREFQGVGEPYARVLDGSSTGGWVSLALQVFYPDFFNGAWASCPDSLDFRAVQLVDIYNDGNAYVDERGTERLSARNRDGSARFTMRHELRMENVLGVGDSWTMSGRQWGAWNATYGPRGADGRPVPLWNPSTGAVDPSAASRWERYDLRRALAVRWEELAPKLSGKLNIWVGEMDDYFLNEAVQLFDQFLQARPSIEARIEYGAGQGHCWTGISPAQMMREMARATTR